MKSTRPATALRPSLSQRSEDRVGSPSCDFETDAPRPARRRSKRRPDREEGARSAGEAGGDLAASGGRAWSAHGNDDPNQEERDTQHRRPEIDVVSNAAQLPPPKRRYDSERFEHVSKGHNDEAGGTKELEEYADSPAPSVAYRQSGEERGGGGQCEDAFQDRQVHRVSARARTAAARAPASSPRASHTKPTAPRPGRRACPSARRRRASCGGGAAERCCAPFLRRAVPRAATRRTTRARRPPSAGVRADSAESRARRTRGRRRTGCDRRAEPRGARRVNVARNATHATRGRTATGNTCRRGPGRRVRR